MQSYFILFFLNGDRFSDYASLDGPYDSRNCFLLLFFSCVCLQAVVVLDGILLWK